MAQLCTATVKFGPPDYPKLVQTPGSALQSAAKAIYTKPPLLTPGIRAQERRLDTSVPWSGRKYGLCHLRPVVKMDIQSGLGKVLVVFYMTR